MMPSFEKKQLIQSYLDNYTSLNRLSFCQLAKKKYHFENYKLSNNNINDKDYIISYNSNVYKLINRSILKNECDVELFETILKELTLNQLYYIGY
jgi:hypothetical protein